jgi:hypothetical protein
MLKDLGKDYTVKGGIIERETLGFDIDFEQVDRAVAGIEGHRRESARWMEQLQVV